MPFKEIDVKKLVDIKRENEDFDKEFVKIGKEYELIRKVVEARIEKGMTQAVLAHTIGVTQQEISRFEREKHMPSLSNFIRILEAVGLSIKLEN